jgi:hypothetical protein
MQFIQVFIRAATRQINIARAKKMTIKTAGHILLGGIFAQYISSPFKNFDKRYTFNNEFTRLAAVWEALRE